MASRSTGQTAALAVAAVATVAATYYVQRLVTKYGIAGTARLIWEGDHLPTEVRESMDSLDEIEGVSIPKEERVLEKIEVTVETARLNTVDGPVFTTNTGGKNPTDDVVLSAGGDNEVLSQYPHLRTDISTLSYRLDKLAATADSAQSHGNVEVKRRKKQLSSIIVKMMERTDALMAACGTSR